MTREEHRNIIAFIEAAVRRDDAAQAPLDVEADAIIRALFVRNPDAAYRVTRLAMAQREELDRMKAELTETREKAGENWLSRLLNKRDRRGRSEQMDGEFSMFPQDMRSR